MLLKDILFEKKEPKKKVLYKNDWLSLMSTPEENGNGYIYSHETRCNGNIVVVLPYERKGKDAWDYGIRLEKVYCWSDVPEYTSLTGGVDKGNSPAQTAVIELKEEAGIICKESDLESFGTCRGTKSTDTVYHLYALNVSGLKKVEPTGEDKGEIVWLSSAEAKKKVVCPLFYVIYARLAFN